MKRILSMFTVATLTIGLLGSCAKINERLDSLEEKVDGLENEEIATIESQVASINSSISDLESIRQKVQAMSDPATGLSKRIEDLKAFVNDELSRYATEDWAKATLVTMEEYEKTCDTVAKIAARVEGFDSSLKACADSLKRWVNGKFGGYYDIATIDAKLAELQEQVDGVDSLSAELAKTREEIDTAKSAIQAEYRAAITTAIETSEGKLTKALQDSIDSVNATIGTLTGRVGILETKVEALKGRVDSLENMIQSVTIVPAYSDGSVEIANDSLYIDCIVSPSKAVTNLAADNVAILVNKVKTKANSGVDTIKINGGNVFGKNADKGVISVRVFIKNKIPAADSTITVAVNVNNGVSNYTTEFVPLTLPVSVSLDKHSIFVQSPDSDKDTTLIATVKNSIKGVTWTSTNETIATVDNAGKVTIKANVSGKDTIIVKTVEGNATDTCVVTVLPEGALKGEFTVNAEGKKVRFSQGNLWYGKVGSAMSATWNFETNQYDSMPASSDNWNNSHVSHFFWSKDASVAYAETYSGSGTSGSDVFFTNATTETAKADFTVNGVTGKYRTLSTAEWQYLINKNNDENIRKGKYKYGVTVCDKENCLILVPDECLNGYSFDNTQTSYSTEEWATAEAAGLVCLPAAGSRNSSSVSYVGVSGCCWLSSTNGEDEAYRVYFNSGDVYPESSGRGSGYSVRLITECQ